MPLRNGDGDLVTAISSANEIPTVGVFTTPPAGCLPSRLMVVPESCDTQSAYEYYPATGSSHPKLMVDPEILTHPVTSIGSHSLHFGSTVEVCACIIFSNVIKSLSILRFLPTYTCRSSRTSSALKKRFNFQLNVRS